LGAGCPLGNKAEPVARGGLAAAGGEAVSGLAVADICARHNPRNPPPTAPDAQPVRPKPGAEGSRAKLLVSTVSMAAVTAK